MLMMHPTGLKSLHTQTRNKLSSNPPNLKDIFTKASGLSSGGSSSARISSGGRGSWTIVGRGFSLTFPVSPSMREFQRQFCDLDPEAQGEKRGAGELPTNSVSGLAQRRILKSRAGTDIFFMISTNIGAPKDFSQATYGVTRIFQIFIQK